MNRGGATGIVFAALLLIAPWPWYLFAVGGLLPIYGGGENIMTPAGKFADAWTAYRKEITLFSSLRADRTWRR